MSCGLVNWLRCFEAVLNRHGRLGIGQSIRNIGVVRTLNSVSTLMTTDVAPRILNNADSCQEKAVSVAIKTKEDAARRHRFFSGYGTPRVQEKINAYER